MGYENLRKGYEDIQNKNEEKVELTREEQDLVKADIETLSSRAKLRVAYLKRKIEQQEQNCDDNGNPDA